ncbi:hypothetical protein QYH69_35440 [Paraburkholderia sp. SARCC-3016]|uniref:hypothetical protein n=1 Tax=Paraburkholderia sp. SARCC-3016 TaxID=3058611 RepID=UPI002807A376|nr:hypothetical protein [Paraburkholderia sp. SARCC-3016]MDQ7982504.1 hypothetical protein [Paraburkholderia sp. SARCC-3016]
MEDPARSLHSGFAVPSQHSHPMAPPFNDVLSAAAYGTLGSQQLPMQHLTRSNRRAFVTPGPYVFATAVPLNGVPIEAGYGTSLLRMLQLPMQTLASLISRAFATPSPCPFPVAMPFNGVPGAAGLYTYQPSPASFYVQPTAAHMPPMVRAVSNGYANGPAAPWTQPEFNSNRPPPQFGSVSPQPHASTATPFTTRPQQTDAAAAEVGIVDPRELKRLLAMHSVSRDYPTAKAALRKLPRETRERDRFVQTLAKLEVDSANRHESLRAYDARSDSASAPTPQGSGALANSSDFHTTGVPRTVADRRELALSLIDHDADVHAAAWAAGIVDPQELNRLFAIHSVSKGYQTAEAALRDLPPDTSDDFAHALAELEVDSANRHESLPAYEPSDFHTTGVPRTMADRRELALSLIEHGAAVHTAARAAGIVDPQELALLGGLG